MQAESEERLEEAENRHLLCSYPGCGRLFKTRFSLRRHTLVHTQEKKYGCEYCGKRFSLLQYMREHTYIHTQECPYVCGVAGCQERFRQNGKLSLHRRTHPEYKLKTYQSSNKSKREDFAPSILNEQLNAGLNHDNDDDKGGDKNCDKDKDDDVDQARPLALCMPDQEDACCSGDPLSSRAYKRQDTGPTCVPVAGSEDQVLGKMQLLPTLELMESSTRPREALPKAELSPGANVLPLYLSCIESALTLSLRPALPLPPALKKTRTSPPVSAHPLDLFELISKCSLSG